LARHPLFIKANIVRSRIKLQLFWNRVDLLLTEQGFPGCDKRIKGRPPASIVDSDASALLEWQRLCVKDCALFLDEGGYMKKIVGLVLLALSVGYFQKIPARADEFKNREAVIAQYKKWLDTLGPEGSRYWFRLDAKRRPHRLYVGEAFFRADFGSQERFVDTYSNYLAGHPEKFMLIDLFDAGTNMPVGEYGFGGFKLYPRSTRIAEK
jgi:hypothetical protein